MRVVLIAWPAALGQPAFQRLLPQLASLVSQPTLCALRETRHALSEASELVDVASNNSQATLEPIETTARKLLQQDDLVEDGRMTKQALPKLSRLEICFHWTPSVGAPSQRTITFNPELHTGNLLGHSSQKPSDISPDWHDLGATLQVTGPNSERERVEAILSILAFGTFHCVLENSFYQDLHLDRFEPEPEAPSEPQSDPQPEDKLPLKDAEEPSTEEDHEPELATEGTASLPPGRLFGKKWSLWNIFPNSSSSSKAASPSSSHPNSPLPPASPLKGPRSLPVRLKPKFRRKQRTQSPSIASSLQTIQNPSTMSHREPRFDAWEIIAPEPEDVSMHLRPDLEASSVPSPVPSDSEEPAHSEPELAAEVPTQAANRFEALVNRISNTILSASPDVSTFPPPQILLRLRDQEHQQRHNENDQISVDARAGLASLVPNNTSTEGSVYHQSLLFLRERCSLFASPTEPSCDTLGWVNVRYYDFALFEAEQCRPHSLFTSGQDCRLEELIECLTLNQGASCSSPDCGRPARDHAFYLTHNTIRCSILLRSASQYESAACALPEGTNNVPHRIWSWAKCCVCGEVSQPRLLSSTAASMSSG